MNQNKFSLFIDLQAGPAPVNGAIRVTQDVIHKTIRDMRRRGDLRPMLIRDAKGNVVGHANPHTT